jgi:hypothetical protein
MPSQARVLSTPRADWAAAASRAFSISGGSEMFSMTKLVRSRPSFLNSSAMSPLTDVLEHAVVPGHVGDGDLRLTGRLGELADQHALEVALDLVGRVHALRADQLLEEGARLGDLEVVGAEGADAHPTRAPADRELRVADQHRVGRAPLLVDVLLQVDEVDIDLEGAAEPVLPALEARQHRHVLGAQRVRARPKMSAICPSLTRMAAWFSRQISLAPFLTSWSSSGNGGPACNCCCPSTR